MTRGRTIPYVEARRLKAENPHSRWRSVAEDFAGEVWPDLRPTFSIRAGEAVFTIGSCFARNIERHLVALGCRVPMMDLRLPAEEWSGEANSAMNKFHPPAFRQCLEWTAAIHDRDGTVTWEDCEAWAFDLGGGQLFDLDMACTAVPKDRFLARRQHIYDVFSQVFSADCLMMTPGLIEAWRDRKTGLHIMEAPVHKAMLADQDRWELHILSYETCLADLLGSIDVVRGRNPAVKVVVTTSPVPMSTTFSGQDVRIANAYSKSVLRAVCGAATRQRPLVDYFPSYESATLSFPANVWKEDRIHVASGFVGKIVTHMLDHYLEGVEDAARHYQRARTLLLSSDLAGAEAAARAALASRPDHAEARVILAESLLRQDRCDEAETELLDLLRQRPDRADLRIKLARAIDRAGDPGRAQEAIDHVETAFDLPSMTLGDFRAVADVVRRRARPDAAERITRRAVEAYPLHVEAYPPLVNVLIDQGRLEEAIEILRKATRLRRTQAHLVVELGGLLAQTGQTEEAIAAAERARIMEPHNKDVAKLMAKLKIRPEPVAP